MSNDSLPFPNNAVRLNATSQDDLSQAQVRVLWERMTCIRVHEEIVEDLNSQGLIRGSTHLCIGMEAGPVGIVSTMGESDLAIGYYRSHGHALALGVPARSTLAEILGRVNGCCGGRGGTKHLMDVSRNYLGAYAVVGQQVPIATGLALALKRAVQSGDRPLSLVTCFLGDGAMNQAATLEAFNMASVLTLPCLFVCENNQYAVSSPARDLVGGGSIARRAEGFGIAAMAADGMDVLATRQAGLDGRSHILSGRGPFFLELQTYRYRGHSVFQVEDRYRDRNELEAWRRRDPLLQLEDRLQELGVLESDIVEARQKIRARLLQEADLAQAGQPLVDASPKDMYADSVKTLDEWGTAI